MTDKSISPAATDEAVKRELKRIEKNTSDANKLVAHYDASRAKLPDADKLAADFEARRPALKGN